MPRRLPRETPRSVSIQHTTNDRPALLIPDAKTAAILGVAHVSAETSKVAGEVASAGIKLLETTVSSFGNCFCALMAYAKEREITSRVIAQEQEITRRVLDQEREITHRVLKTERETTARMEIWSATVIAEAEARTEQVRIRAAMVLAKFEDRAAQRDAKEQVIHRFLDEYGKWNSFIVQSLQSRTHAMSLSERESLNSHVGMLLQRANEMQTAIVGLAQTL